MLITGNINTHLAHIKIMKRKKVGKGEGSNEGKRKIKKKGRQI